jgi:hypothetical protein
LYNDFIEKGRLSEKAKSWDQAIVNYQNALNAKPGDKLAQDKLDEIQQIIDDLTNALKSEQEKQEQFNKLLKDADALFSSDDFLGAKTNYESALALIPDNGYVQKQIEECVKREKNRSLAEEEKGYRKLIEKADENFDLKDFEKAKDYYTRAVTMRPVDPYPQKRLSEIENLLNPVVVGSVNLEPLGDPYPENSIMDGYAALVQADIQRKNLKDKKVENAVSSARKKEGDLGEKAEDNQSAVTNQIYQVTSSIEQYTVESDENRKAVVEALRRADEESMLAAGDEVSYKQSELLRSQEKLDNVKEGNNLDYSARDEVYRDNTDKLQSYAGALRVQMEERNKSEYDSNIGADRSLEKIDIDMEGVDLTNIDRQKKNEGVVEEIVLAAQEKQKTLTDSKRQELLRNDAAIETVDIAVQERQITDARYAQENKEQLKSVEVIVLESEKERSNVALDRTIDNKDAVSELNVKAEADYTDRELNRKENAEVMKQNEVELLEGKRERLEQENFKYLRNKSEIENEDLKKKDVVDKDEKQVALNVSGMENLNIKSTEVAADREMTDEDQRLRARAEVEIINANTEEYSNDRGDDLMQNVQKVDDLERTLEAGFVNRENEKKEELLAAQDKLTAINTEKPEKPRIKNALGEEYPEGVSQESFTQNDENGLMKAIITRRIVVIDGVGNVYVRTQTLSSTTYSKNDQPITEYKWNNETTGPHLQKHY